MNEQHRREKIAATQRERWEADLAARQRLGKLRDAVAGGLDDPRKIGRELDLILHGLRGTQ